MACPIIITENYRLSIAGGEASLPPAEFAFFGRVTMIISPMKMILDRGPDVRKK